VQGFGVSGVKIKARTLRCEAYHLRPTGYSLLFRAKVSSSGEMGLGFMRFAFFSGMGFWFKELS
jgi:hypothetical protein